MQRTPTVHTAPASTADVAPTAMVEQDAARYIGFSREFLRQARIAGRREHRTPGPPFVKVGRAVRYLVVDLDSWLLQHRRDPR